MLTEKQRRFVEAYRGHGSGLDAARAAGYGGDDASLKVAASRLLSHPDVRAALEEREGDMLVRAEAAPAALEALGEEDQALVEGFAELFSWRAAGARLGLSPTESTRRSHLPAIAEAAAALIAARYVDEVAGRLERGLILTRIARGVELDGEGEPPSIADRLRAIDLLHRMDEPLAPVSGKIPARQGVDAPSGGVTVAVQIVGVDGFTGRG